MNQNHWRRRPRVLLSVSGRFLLTLLRILLLLCIILGDCDYCTASIQTSLSRRQRQRQYPYNAYQTQRQRQHDNPHGFPHPTPTLTLRANDPPDPPPSHSPRYSIANMTCHFFTQPLNHFMLPRMNSNNSHNSTYEQRYCVYDGFVLDHTDTTAQHRHTSPVFFYTGNESPLETYINHTGLMWELADIMHASVVFAEHRYEGLSLPRRIQHNCLAYAVSIQAVADYARVLRSVPAFMDRPVIAFGGSYGGMLAAYVRMLMPGVVAGAIAASAPMWGFPLNFPADIDTAAQVITYGLDQQYPSHATTHQEKKNQEKNNHCVTNLRAAWPLIRVLLDHDAFNSNRNHSNNSRHNQGRDAVATAFRLCPLPPHNNYNPFSSQVVLDWAQAPWFDLAEGSYPYPSNYIVYALLHQKQNPKTSYEHVQLPAWPLQHACWNASRLHQDDWGIRMVGNVQNVTYQIQYGNVLTLTIDWDRIIHVDVHNTTSTSFDTEIPALLTDLLSNVRDAVSVWYNVTQDVQCYDIREAAPNNDQDQEEEENPHQEKEQPNNRSAPATACREYMHTHGSWPALCCNEDMNLILTEARGLGKDVFWPPSHDRGTYSHADVIAQQEDANNNHNNNNQEDDNACLDPYGFFGFPPRSSVDPWAHALDTLYGGTRILDAPTNIVFSNGLLDPWSAAGVYRPGTRINGNSNSSTVSDVRQRLILSSVRPVPGLYVQDILPHHDPVEEVEEDDFCTCDGNEEEANTTIRTTNKRRNKRTRRRRRRMIALVMEYGGHHTDLMYASDLDPPSITVARQIEQRLIQEWIEDWQFHYNSEGRSGFGCSSSSSSIVAVEL